MKVLIGDTAQDHPFQPVQIVETIVGGFPHGGEQGREWAAQTWAYAKMILPLLLAGVFVAGLLLDLRDILESSTAGASHVR